jgi:predicted transcriptional regulator
MLVLPLNTHEADMATAHPVAVKLDPEIHGRVRELAKAQNRSAHYLMREAITQYVEREEKREAFRQEALSAWTEFQETGLHATAEEVDQWLTSWGTEDEQPAPACHK